MQSVVEKLKEIETGEVGIIVYSQMKQEYVASLNPEMSVPLASAAKVALGFCIAKWVEEKSCKWNDMLEEISFDPKEDSHIIYPHLQQRKSITLQDAVEVMIACHDSVLANKIVQYCGGWEIVNQKIQSNFDTINITINPSDIDNKGNLNQLIELLCQIIQGYKSDPEIWIPIIKGLVRPIDSIEGIPNHCLSHMSGGLESVLVDIGIIGKFNENSLLYVLGANHLPNRFTNREADGRVVEAMKLLYKEYLKQEDKVSI